jgi:hypothetical protein
MMPPKVIITAANGYTSGVHTYVESDKIGFSIKTNEKADHDQIAENCRRNYIVIE